MEIGGPFGEIKYHIKIPAPGAYGLKPERDFRAPSFNSRLEEHYL
jgi:hypothetical protein